MNRYFLFNALKEAENQLDSAGIKHEEWLKPQLIELAMQLATIKWLETISNNLIDLETELITIKKLVA